MATVSRPRNFNSAEMQRRVRHPLGALRGTIRNYVLLEGLLVAVIYLAVGFWIGFGLDFGLFALFRFDWLLELQEATGNTADVWFRAIILVAFLVGLVVLVTRKVLMRMFKEFSDPALALVLERRFPRQLGDRLITAVELADPRNTEKLGYSADMLERTIEEAADRVERLPYREVFNWARLTKLGVLAVASTIGVYVIVMIVGMVTISVGAQDRADGRSSGSAGSFFGRFNRAFGTWFARDIMLRDAYWMRNAYLELVRFQESPRHPGEMRVGRDEVRPDIHVKAFKWVIRDDRPARQYARIRDAASETERSVLVRNHYGWRPLAWSDLGGIVDAGLLARANAIPRNWPSWKIQVDDLAALVPKNLVPAEWQGRTIGEIERGKAADPAYKALGDDLYAASRDRLFNWQEWTLDRLEMQLQDSEVIAAFSVDQKDGFAALREVLKQLEERALGDDNRGRVRMLEIPEQVRFFYRGDTSANPPNNYHDQLKDRGLYQRKYILSLGDLKESVRFHVRGDDFFTATRRITLVPPTAVKKLTLRMEEPAYIYHRIKGNPLELRGLRQWLPDQFASVSGDTSTIVVKHGASLKLVAETDRTLKGKVQMLAPQKAEEKGALLPSDQQLPVVGADGKSFTMEFAHITRPYEFVLEFNDEDNVKGRRRILIRVKDDRAPEIFDVEMKVGLRKPRVKKDNKDGGATIVELPIEALLITPDAELPFKASLKDDYGLTLGHWKYVVEPVQFELLGESGELPKGPAVLGGPTRDRRAGLVTSAFQFMPAEFAPWAAPAYLGAMERMLRFDIDNGPEEGRVDLPGFGNRLRELTTADPVLASLRPKLRLEPRSPAMLRDYQLVDDDRFFVGRYLPKLKSRDAAKEGQLHYMLKVNLETEDTNIETGPGVGRSKANYTFLVVSENELLAQIALEEEALRDSLEGAEDKIKDARSALESLGKQLSVPGPLGFDTSIVMIEDGNSMVNKGASSIREAANSYLRIAMEMRYNNVRKDRQAQLIENILDPLQGMVLPGGEVSQVDNAFQALVTQLEADKKAGLVSPKTKGLQQDAYIKTDLLLDKLNRVLAQMEADITWARSLEDIIRIERDQRKAEEEVQRLYIDRAKELVGGISK